MPSGPTRAGSLLPLWHLLQPCIGRERLPQEAPPGVFRPEFRNSTFIGRKALWESKALFIQPEAIDGTPDTLLEDACLFSSDPAFPTFSPLEARPVGG